MSDTIVSPLKTLLSIRLLRKVVLEVLIFLYKEILYQILPFLLHLQNILVVVHTLPLLHLSILELVPCKGRMKHLHLPANHDSEYQTH